MGKIANIVIDIMVSAFFNKKKQAKQARQKSTSRNIHVASDGNHYNSEAYAMQVQAVYNSELLAMQRLVMPDSPEALIMSEEELIEAVLQTAKNDARILEDSKKIISETVNPGVFFSRFQLMEEKCSGLVKFEPYVPFNNTKPHEMLAEIREKKEGITKHFLERYYDSVKRKADEMKTEKGRKNQYIKYYNSLEPYFDKMSEENIEMVRKAIE